MLGSKLLNSVVVAGLLAFSNAAQAAVYDFGSLLTSGGAAPNSFAANPFATLTTTNNGGGNWTFNLLLNNSFSSFGSNAFLGSISFDFTPPVDDKTLTTQFVNSNVTNLGVKGTSGTGGSGLGSIDFGTDFDKADNKGSQARLDDAGEYIKWSVSGLGNSSLNNMFVHVQAIGDTGYSAKYTPVMTPVPEPETYAMLLAGLGLIGFSARRRA